MKFKAILGIVLLAISVQEVNAQHGTCGTDRFMEELVSNNPELAIERAKYLDQLTGVAENPPQKKLGKKADPRIIPVVFHVIHEYGEENISKEQIEDQLRILNEDFRMRNADTADTHAMFKDRAADAEVEFRLAQLDPDGNCTDGITRTYSPLTDGGDEAVKQVKRIWNYREYLNIWVVKRIDRNSSGNSFVAGYAYLPWGTGSAYDGIVIRHDFVGSIGTSSASRMGRTLTHEVGHYLGLLHPFQNGCNNNNCTRNGDRVCDTPPVSSSEVNISKCVRGNSCTTDSPDEPDNIENFMDYASGHCQNMFTDGQKAVLDFSFGNTNYRQQNVSTASHNATGIFLNKSCAPVADFYSDEAKRVVCEGGQIKFNDLSWNGDVSDYLWTFEGGTPKNSTFAEPTVTYNTAGIYKVTLKVSNTDGSNEITKDAFIEVIPAISDLQAPHEEDVENATSVADWTFEHDGSFGWQTTTISSYSGDKCFRAFINQNAPANTRYAMYSPAIDMTPYAGLAPKLSFRAGYSLREQNGGELLAIYGSSDCGENWRVIAGFPGSSKLSSKEGLNPNFVPSNLSEWKTLSADLSRNGFDTVSNLILKFDLTSRAGNSVYIDDINIGLNNVAIGEINAPLNNLSIYPNPSAGLVHISFDNLSSEEMYVKVLDVAGREIEHLGRKANRGKNKLDIELKSAGVYFVQVESAQGLMTKKLIIAK